MTHWFFPLLKLVLYIKSSGKLIQFLVLVLPFQTEVHDPQTQVPTYIGLVSELNNNHLLLPFPDNIGIMFEICPKIIPFQSQFQFLFCRFEVRPATPQRSNLYWTQTPLVALHSIPVTVKQNGRVVNIAQNNPVRLGNAPLCAVGTKWRAVQYGQGDCWGQQYKAEAETLPPKLGPPLAPAIENVNCSHSNFCSVPN